MKDVAIASSGLGNFTYIDQEKSLDTFEHGSYVYGKVVTHITDTYRLYCEKYNQHV